VNDGDTVKLPTLGSPGPEQAIATLLDGMGAAAVAAAEVLANADSPVKDRAPRDSSGSTRSTPWGARPVPSSPACSYSLRLDIGEH